MKRLRKIWTGWCVMAVLLLLCPLSASSAEEPSTGQPAEEKVDIKEIVFGHIGDSYEWHITSWGDTHLTIPLPIIVYSHTTGWHVFSSARLEENGGSYEGLSIAPAGSPYEGKLVEHDAAGNEIRPFDISITKVTLALLMNSVLLTVIILCVARWYKRHPKDSAAPGGFVGLMEMLIMMVNDDIIKSCVGPKYKKFAPYLLTAFFFIFINNLMGLVPFFPGGANVTGNIAITMVLAVCTFLAVNLFGTKTYWKDIFWPDVPWVVESAGTDDAVHRVLRHLHQAVCPDDPFVCQHAGRTRSHACTDRTDFHLCQHGAGPERHTDFRISCVQPVHECPRTAGSLYPGLRIYHAVGRIYRTGTGRAYAQRRSEHRRKTINKITL